MDILIEISGTKVNIIQDNKLLRAGDEPLLLGDNKHISELGFVPKYTFHETLIAVFNDWMNRI